MKEVKLLKRIHVCKKLQNYFYFAPSEDPIVVFEGSSIALEYFVYDVTLLL